MANDKGYKQLFFLCQIQNFFIFYPVAVLVYYHFKLGTQRYFSVYFYYFTYTGIIQQNEASNRIYTYTVNKGFNYLGIKMTAIITQYCFHGFDLGHFYSLRHFGQRGSSICHEFPAIDPLAAEILCRHICRIGYQTGDDGTVSSPLKADAVINKSRK